MNVCLDACFLIALYDARDQYHVQARSLFVDYFDPPRRNVAIIMWPVLYEAVSTQLVKHRLRIREMESELKTLLLSKRLDYLPDTPYREKAFDECLAESLKPHERYRALSLTDRVFRGALSDTNVRMDAILTFNAGDFSDICEKCRKTILP